MRAVKLTIHIGTSLDRDFLQVFYVVVENKRAQQIQELLKLIDKIRLTLFVFAFACKAFHSQCKRYCLQILMYRLRLRTVALAKAKYDSN